MCISAFILVSGGLQHLVVNGFDRLHLSCASVSTFHLINFIFIMGN
jgi:hypothetical protein